MFETVDEQVEKTRGGSSAVPFAIVVVLSMAIFAGILLLAVALE